MVEEVKVLAEALSTDRGIGNKDNPKDSNRYPNHVASWAASEQATYSASVEIGRAHV